MTQAARHMKRDAKRTVLWLSLFVLFLNALLPAGYMPGARAEDGSFTIVICSASGLKTLTLDAAGNAISQDEDGGAESTGCLYWTATAHYIAAPEITLTAMALPAAASPRAPQGHGVVLPPAIGPPLGAQAPPFFLI
ncbi:DUF2946 family protein [Tepidicaulis sp.]|uniref:DUF2946 family protein n=1 Tax=Tepidicaulis sp. TaxID=1920809 RepID=UPI003B5C4384